MKIIKYTDLIRQIADPLEGDTNGYHHKSPSLFIDRHPSTPPLFIILKTLLLVELLFENSAKLSHFQPFAALEGYMCFAYWRDNLNTTSSLILLFY